MKPTDADPAAFWDYSLRIYANPGVADACISLQDRHGCDVNVLLLCLWLAETRRLVLQVSDFEAILRSAAAPNERLVQPVREVRRWFKLWSQDAIAAEPHASAYKALKEAELHGERMVQSQLIAGMNLAAFGSAPTAEAAARASFYNYRKTFPETDGAASELDGLVAKVWH